MSVSLSKGESSLVIQVLDSDGVERAAMSWSKLDYKRLIELEVAILEAVIKVGKAHEND